MISKTVPRWLTLAALVGLSLGVMVPAALATDITACPFTISSPGTFDVTKNLTATGTSCIKVHSDNVAIDLKGHTITGDKTVGHHGITDEGLFFVTGVAIANGKIKDFAFGIGFFGDCCDSSHVITITHVDSSDNKFDGIFIEGSDNALTDVRANRNGEDGIDLGDSSDNLITNSQANDNTSSGIFADSHNAVSNVRTIHDGGSGMFFDGFDNVVTKSTASNNTGDGMEFDDDDNRVSDSTANDNTVVGMDLHFCCNNTVTKVTANHNATGVVLSCDGGHGNAVRVSAHNNSVKNLSEIGTCTDLLNNAP